MTGRDGADVEVARLRVETERLRKEAEQRAAELAIINGVQEGMAESLDFQAIADLVGDRLREVLRTGDIGIEWLDYDAYTKSLRASLANFRAVYARAECILIGPPDRGGHGRHQFGAPLERGRQTPDA